MVKKKDDQLTIVPLPEHEFFIKMRVFDKSANQICEINKPLTRLQIFQLDALMKHEFGIGGLNVWA